MNRLVRTVQWAALLVPALVVLHLVLRYGVNVPYADQWALVNPMARLATGTFHWTELLAQHNEHRIVFPKLIMLGLAYVTRWDIRAELLVNVALGVGTLSVLWVLARPVLREAGAATRLWAAFVVSAMVFSLAQWENWLWGWQIQWFLNILAALSSIAWAAASLGTANPWRHVAAAAAAAVVSQYSLAGGIAAWPAVAIVLAAHPKRRVILPVWAAVAATATALYFVGYVSPPHHPSHLTPIERPGDFLLYLGNYMSGVLGRRAAVGFAVAAAFVVLSAGLILRYRRNPALVLPWVAVGAFAGANAIVTGIGRLGLGVQQALDSRYTTMAMLMSVALVPLGILAFRAWAGERPPALRRIMAIAGAAALTIPVIVTDVASLRGWTGFNQRMVAGRDCLLAVDDAPDSCLLYLYPITTVVRDLAGQLPSFGWSGLGTLAPGGTRNLALTGPGGTRTWRVAPEDGSGGVLDEIDIRDGTFKARGWARRPAGSPEGVGRVLVAAGGVVLGEAEVTGERPDVAAAFNDPALRRSGWELRTADSPAIAGVVRAYLVIGDDLLLPVGGGKRIERGR